MAIQFSSNLQKSAPSVPYLLSDKDLRGGFRVVADDSERDAIHPLAKANGMIVYSVAPATFTVWNSVASAFEAWDVSSMVSTGEGLTRNATSGALELDTTVTDALYPGLIHGHEISEVSGLQNALDAAAPSTHNHALETLANVDIADLADIGAGDLLKWNEASGTWINASLEASGIAPLLHVHDWSAIQNVPQVSAMPGVTVSSVDPISTDGVNGDIWFVIPA